MSFIKKIIVVAALCCVFASLSSMEVKVIEVSGKVEVQNGDKWVAVSKGQILSAGAVISTGFKSEAVLSFDETVIKVKALTRLTIEQLFEKNGDKASSVYLDTGSISADVKPAENKRVGFSVKTPAATASVRGTSGVIYSDGTLRGTSGRWCITPAQEKLVFTNNYVVSDVSDDKEEPENAGGEISGGAAAGEPGAVNAEEPAVSQQAESNNTMEDFDFSYPDDLGAVYVSAGENMTVKGGSFVTPQENKIINATGGSGVQLLSETEKVVPAAAQSLGGAGKAASDTVVVPEKPKYGTVKVTVTLPSL